MVARNFKAVPSVDNESLLVTQSGAGAVERTVQDKLRDVVSVKDFGAVGDGVTDDTAAIQAALSSGAKEVELSTNGTFLVSSTLTLPSGVTLTGNGSSIVCSTHFTVLSATGSNRLQNLRINGPTDGTYTVGSIAIRFAGTKNVGSAPTYAQDLIVENCIITGFGAYGIKLEYAKRVHLSGNTLASIGYAGIGGTSCEDVSIASNIIENVGPGTTGDAYGIFVDRENGTSETEDPRSYRCVISANLIKNVVASPGIGGQGIDTHAGVDFVIEGNTITNCQAGIFLTASSISGAQRLGVKRCVVSGNTISSTYFVNYGILVYGARESATVYDYAEECVVSNNILTGHGSKTSGTIPAIFASVTKNLLLTGNIVKESGGNCLLLDYSNITFNVSSNTFVDPNSTSYATPACIRVYSIDNKGIIGDNIYRFENAALATFVAVNSVRIESGLTGLDLDFTRSSFLGIDATHLTFTALTSVRNNGLMALSGQSTIVVSSGVADGITDATFATRFPYAPNVTFTLRNPYNQGGKFPIIGIDTAVPVSATGFRIYARPYDGSTWSATGSLTFDWTAS